MLQKKWFDSPLLRVRHKRMVTTLVRHLVADISTTRHQHDPPSAVVRWYYLVWYVDTPCGILA